MKENMNIAFSPPDVGEEEIKEVTEALRSGWITTGPKTKLLEKQVAELCHTSKAACLNSATACLEMALRIMGIQEGDEIITSAYTYTASASVVCHLGAKLVLVDTAKDSFEMDYDQLEKAITPKTKAIIPVDIGGVISDYDKVFAAVEAKKDMFVPANERQAAFGRVLVIADGAHSFGASKIMADGSKKMSGEFADFTSFSFHAVKNFTTAEGGALVWRDHDGLDNEVIYKELMLLSLHGQSKDALAKTQLGAWEYDIIAPYYKCNMTDIMAAIGLAQMRRYAGLLERRKVIIEKYNEAFKDLPVTVLDHFSHGHASCGHLYLMRFTGKDREYTNMIITKMAEHGIATNVHYKPLPMHTAYKNLGFDIADYPNAYAMFENEMTLPLHTCLTDEEVDYIIDTLKEIVRETA